MKEKVLYAIWSILFIVCAGLGFIPEPTGFVKFLLIAFAVVFFIPGLLILYDAQQAKNRTAILRIRVIAALSLSLTLLFLVFVLLSVTGSEAIGLYLNVLLGIFSTPMFCSQHWILSLFLWACLLAGSFYKPTKK